MWNKLDKIMLWRGWVIVKWPFGFIILWLVLFLIWNLIINPGFEQASIDTFKSSVLEINQRLTHIKIESEPAVKNIAP